MSLPLPGWTMPEWALAEWYDLRDLHGISREITEWIAGWGPDWLASVVSGVIGALGVLAIIGPALLFLIWLERKVIARMQSRYGPNRVGPVGLLQPVADAIAASGMPVVVGPILDVPGSQFDPYDASYANPALLQRAGLIGENVCAQRFGHSHA